MHDNFVSCLHCLCSVPNGFGYEGNTLGYDTEAEAIAAWNRRAAPPDIDTFALENSND